MMPFKGNNSHNLPTSSIYPIVDGTIQNLTWDTANPGYCATGAYWGVEDEFNAYILRANTTTLLPTTNRTLSLYKFNLMTKSLTKICTVAGTYNAGDNGAGFQTSFFLHVNVADNYFLFIENGKSIYAADLSNGSIISTFAFSASAFVDGAEIVFAANKKDFYLFVSMFKSVPVTTFVQFDRTNRLFSWGTPANIPGCAIVGYSATQHVFIYPISPSSINMNATSVFVIVTRTYQSTGNNPTGNFEDIALNIFDISTGLFNQTMSFFNMQNYLSNGSDAMNPDRYYVYNNIIKTIVTRGYQTNYLGTNPTNLKARTLTFANLTVSNSNTANLGSSGTNGWHSAQRYDRLFFAHWDYNKNVWFCRGDPTGGGWSIIATTPFIPSPPWGLQSYVYTVGGKAALVFTTSGLMICGQVSNATTAAPVAFIPLANTGG